MQEKRTQVQEKDSEKKLTIGIIIDCLQGGGAERCAADLSVYFCRQGYPVVIFTDLSKEVRYEADGQLVDFNYKLNDQERTLAHKVEKLKGLKKQYGIDVSISFMQFANYVNILSKTEEKIILTTHSVNSIYAGMENSVFWSDHTFGVLYQYADLITFPSEYCRLDWIKHYGDRNLITRTLYNPVHLMEDEGEQQGRENIILAIGRLHSIKRQWHIIQAFKQIKESCPGYKLILLGEGELRGKLEKLVDTLELRDQVEMPGNVRNVQAYLKRARLLLLTSYCEAMPCSVMEALSAGVPVISCDSPGGIREELGIPESVSGVTEPVTGTCGIVTPYIREEGENQREISYIASEAVRLLKNEQLRNQLAVNGKETAQKFKIQNVGKAWLEAISEKKRSVDQEAFEREREEQLNDRPVPSHDGMYKEYYQLLEKWMLLHEKKGSTGEYFYRHNLRRIIIYGMGKMAQHFLKDLEGTGLQIVCAMDKKAIYKQEEFPVITGEEYIPDADCIVVTVVYDYDSIRKKLETKCHIPVISLKTILDECVDLQ